MANDLGGAGGLVVYKGTTLEADDEHPRRLDLLAENRIIAECKSVSEMARDEIFRALCRTYLKMGKLQG